MKRFLVCAFLALGFPPTVFAANDLVPIVELGTKFHTGPSGTSLTGSRGYSLNLRAEQGSGIFRAQAAASIEYSGGNATIGSDSTNYHLGGMGFHLGGSVFPFPSGGMQPFLIASGIVSAQMLKLVGSSETARALSQSLAFGFEAGAGVDIHFGSDHGTAVRVRACYRSQSATLAGMSGFDLSGFSLVLGVAY